MFISRPTSILPVGPESKTALAMTDAGAVFLASLTTDQEAMALWPLESGERFNWDYRPIPRQGLSLKMMNSHQQKLALALLSAGLSPRGLGKALGIMALEKVLQDLEGPGGRFQRDPDLYYFTLFGRPSLQEPWAWRVEGHHLSLNFLVLAGERVASAPHFFGANPARVPQGPLAGGASCQRKRTWPEVSCLAWVRISAPRLSSRPQRRRTSSPVTSPGLTRSRLPGFLMGI